MVDLFSAFFSQGLLLLVLHLGEFFQVLDEPFLFGYLLIFSQHTLLFAGVLLGGDLKLKVEFLDLFIEVINLFTFSCQLIFEVFDLVLCSFGFGLFLTEFMSHQLDLLEGFFKFNRVAFLDLNFFFFQKVDFIDEGVDDFIVVLDLNFVVMFQFQLLGNEV